MEKIIVLILLSLAGVALFCLLSVMVKDIWQDSKWYEKTKGYKIKELEEKLKESENRLGAVTACCNRTEVRMEEADKDNETRIRNVQRDLGSLVEFLNIEAEYRDGLIYKNKKVEGLK